MIESAGLAIVYNNKLLVLHPTNHQHNDGYSIPKGKIEKGEDKIDAAIRETKEETNIDIKKEMIGEEGPVVEYRKRKKDGSPGKKYKNVYWFFVPIDNLSQIGMEKEELDQDDLALDEVDWGGFVGGQDLEKGIFWRFKEPICKYLNLIDNET